MLLLLLLLVMISPSFAEAFGGKENQDAKGRATCAAASASPGEGSRRTPSAPRGSKRDARLFAAAMAHHGKLERGHRTESPFGPPKARLKALQRDDIHAGELGRPAASNRTSGALQNPHRSLPSPTGRSAGDNAWSRWNGSGGGNGVLCGTPWFRAKRRVALRAARARGVPARTPKMLMVPSRLMDSTVASRAAAFTPPTPARPRFVPRQHFVGKHTASTPVPAVTATAGAEGTEKRSAMDSKAAVRRGTLKSRAACSGGAVRERGRRGLELVGEFDHEVHFVCIHNIYTGYITEQWSCTAQKSSAAEQSRLGVCVCVCVFVCFETCDGVDDITSKATKLTTRY